MWHQAPEYQAFLVETVPEWWVSAIQIFLGNIIAETGTLRAAPRSWQRTACYTPINDMRCLHAGFYWGHRLLHAYPFMYQFHKRHHEYVDTGVITTFYVSFIDALITDLIPLMFAIVVLNMHIYTAW